ncbi:MAG: hypothetical protein ACOX6N_04700 [Patescibacteria group bacterium]|jgi:hypothetical protein
MQDKNRDEWDEKGDRENKDMNDMDTDMDEERQRKGGKTTRDLDDFTDDMDEDDEDLM